MPMGSNHFKPSDSIGDSASRRSQPSGCNHSRMERDEEGKSRRGVATEFRLEELASGARLSRVSGLGRIEACNHPKSIREGMGLVRCLIVPNIVRRSDLYICSRVRIGRNIVRVYRRVPIQGLIFRDVATKFVHGRIDKGTVIRFGSNDLCSVKGMNMIR